jgi:hypothetical protein
VLPPPGHASAELRKMLEQMPAPVPYPVPVTLEALNADTARRNEVRAEQGRAIVAKANIDVNPLKLPPVGKFEVRLE